MTLTFSIKRRLKEMVLPRDARMRRLPAGIGRGLRMRVDFAHQTRLFLGLHECELNRRLRSVCRPGYACFDVGGQDGYDALVMARLSGGRVVSFECDAAACAQMAANFVANPVLAGRLRVQRAFVCEETSETGDALSLDTFALSAEGFIPDVIKIDIEGGEYLALLGCKEILRRRKPHLIVETHSPELERSCIELLRQSGYNPRIVNQRRWLKDYRPIPHNRWLVAMGRRGR